MSGWREDLEKKFGATIFRTGFGGEVVSSGSFVVDFLTGIGGFPLGHMVELFGQEGCGKTTVTLATIKCALDKGMPVLYLDFESTVSDAYLRRLGIDPAVLVDYRVFPESLEDGWMIIKQFCERYQNGLIAVDSLAAVPPKFDVEKMQEIIGQTKVASMALVMSIALKQMTKVLKESNNCLIFVNQERSKIMTRGVLATSKTTPGGAAVKFFAALRVQMKLLRPYQAQDVDVLDGQKKDNVVGIESGVIVVKNKFAPSYRKGRVYVRMNEGIDNVHSAIQVGLHMGVLQKKGSFYYADEKYSGDVLGKKKEHGLERLRKYFVSNPEEFNKLMMDISAYLAEKISQGG